jgi:hypothetical protein
MIIDAKTQFSSFYRKYTLMGALANACESIDVGEFKEFERIVDKFGNDIDLKTARTHLSKLKKETGLHAGLNKKLNTFTLFRKE